MQILPSCINPFFSEISSMQNLGTGKSKAQPCYLKDNCCIPCCQKSDDNGLSTVFVKSVTSCICLMYMIWMLNSPPPFTGELEGQKSNLSFHLKLLLLCMEKYYGVSIQFACKLYIKMLEILVQVTCYQVTCGSPEKNFLKATVPLRKIFMKTAY